MFRPLLVLSLLVFFSPPAQVDQIHDGVSAFERQDYPSALRLLQPLAQQGNASAQFHIGQMYEWGWGVKQDYVEAAKWYRKAADQARDGVAQRGAQDALGWIYANGWGVKQDGAEALGWFRKAADQGDTEAMSDISMVYYGGLGVKPDNAEALQWVRDAAEHGDVMEQSWLGAVYIQGNYGVKPDCSESMKWLRMAADQGDLMSFESIGRRYEDGTCVKQDYAEAAMWYRRAADNGEVISQSSLAMMYHRGQGVRRDDVEAARLFRPLAEDGNMEVQVELGQLLAAGRDMQPDYEEAYYWLSLPSKCWNPTVSHGDDTSAALAEVKQHLTSEQIAEVDRRVASFNWPKRGRVGTPFKLLDGTKGERWYCGCNCTYTEPLQPVGPAAPAGAIPKAP